MEEKKIFKLIKKFIPLIVAVSLLASVAARFYLVRQLTYTASVVINYKYENAELGKTPSGTDLDVNEIKSSAIMSKVMERNEIAQSYSVDSLTSRITITACPDEDKVAQKEAALENGEQYTYVPTTYIVQFRASNSEGEDFARLMVDEILNVYFSVFSENYVNMDHISNKLDKIYENNYDYIEIVDYIEDSIEDTINVLYQRDSFDPYYHSTSTGLSFGDIIDEFNYIDSVKIKSLYSKLYKYQITKDKTALVAKNKTKINNNTIDSANELGRLQDINQVIDEYVKKMRESGNTDIKADYILKDIYNKNVTDSQGNVILQGDQTVTYDELIYAWRNHKLNDKIASIDTEHCNYIIDTFSACTGKCNGQCANSTKTCMELTAADYDEVADSIDEEIKSVVEELSDLYKQTITTNDEYNSYLGCENIEVLSTASVIPSMNVNTYSIIAFIFIMVVFCGGLVLIGRLNDIITANLYTDHKTGLRNRAYFDNYLKKSSGKVLDDGTVMASITITNQQEINEMFGRDVGDTVLKLFADELKKSFAKMNAMLVYNGNSHYIVTIENSDSITAEEALSIFLMHLNDRQDCGQVTIKCKMGVSQTFRNKIYSGRGLLIEAVQNAKEYVIEAKKSS